MKKLTGIIVLVILLASCVWAGSRFVTGSGTVTVTTDTLELNLFDSYALKYLGYNFKITQADTLRDDSITVTIQTSRDKITWSDLFSFAIVPDDDTSTVGLWWNDTDTCATYLMAGKPWQSYMQTQLIFHDSTTQADAETLRPTGDATDTLNWHASTGTDLYAVVDEASLDTADYIYVVGEDTACVLGFGEHTAYECIVDSLTFNCVAFWWDTACSMKMGFNIGDTTLGHVDSLTSIWDDAFAVTDSPTTYSYTSATSPHGTAWNIFEVDSVCGAVQSTWADTTAGGTSGQVRVAQEWIEVWYTKGGLWPVFQWRIDQVIRE